MDAVATVACCWWRTPSNASLGRVCEVCVLGVGVAEALSATDTRHDGNDVATLLQLSRLLAATAAGGLAGELAAVAVVSTTVGVVVGVVVVVVAQPMTLTVAGSSVPMTVTSCATLAWIDDDDDDDDGADGCDDRVAGGA